ncbi:MAG: class I SAM-dependent RNA methyltransferase [bacterium]
MTIRQARVEKIVEGGLGLARDGHATILLPLAAPGDHVEYSQAGTSGKNHAEGQIERVLEASPDRVEPSCDVYGICGGCQLQHLSAPAQIAVKQSVAAETLRRLGGIETPGAIPIEPAPAQFGYRHRATFHIQWKAREPVVGFFRRRSHDVVEIARCPLLSPAANEALTLLREKILPAAAPLAPSRAEVVATDDGRAEIALHVAAPPAQRGVAELAAAANSAGLRALHWEASPANAATLHERGAPLAYEVPSIDGAATEMTFDARVFTQANFAGNAKLVSAVAGIAVGGAMARLADLHAGCGNFSVPLLWRTEYAHLVDVNARALAHAERAAARDRTRRPGSGPKRIDVSASPAADALARLAATRAPRPDLVILDPPRQGAPEIIRPLLAMEPPRILYVSCNVPTLARDLAALVRGGYAIDSLRLFDLYPQTAHVEALAALSR